MKQSNALDIGGPIGGLVALALRTSDLGNYMYT